MEQKAYMDIVRLGHKTTQGILNDGDHIVVQEKLDGANASFCLNPANGDLAVFSRRTKLDESNTLGGFYGWVMDNIAGKVLRPNTIYFGEWLNPHKVKYPEKTFYLFDLYDVSTHRYLPFEEVRNEAQRLHLNLIPVFYEGVYQGYAHLEQFVGKTLIGGKLGEVEQGEGIVVKNVTFINQFGRQMFVKMVTEAFAEVQKQKLPKDPNKPKSKERLFVDTYVTKARVEKFLHKLVDEQVLDAQWGIEDMGVVLKELNHRIYDDLIKEEADYLPSVYDTRELRKSLSTVMPNFVKEIIKERQKDENC